jgi:hypothetical protein
MAIIGRRHDTICMPTFHALRVWPLPRCAWLVTGPATRPSARIGITAIAWDRANCPQVPYTWSSSQSARTCHAVKAGVRGERALAVLIAEPAGGWEEPTGGNHALVRPPRLSLA